MKEKRGRGQPRKFETELDFEKKFLEYIHYCRDNKRFSNIAGFCAYCHMTRETFYKQKEYYPDTYNIMTNILEDEVLQDNTYRAQLYLKNKFGYTDKVEQTTTGTLEITARQDWQSRIAALDEDKRERLLHHMREIKGLLSE